MTPATINTPWLRLILWAVLIHVFLIALSIIEVAIYSYAITPGHDQSFYEQHAQVSGPYVSLICGPVLFFFVARMLSKKGYDQRKSIGLLLPFFYISIDVIFLLLSAVDWGQHYLVFVVSFMTKIMAAYLGATTIKPREVEESHVKL